EGSLDKFALAKTAHQKLLGQGIDGLGAHTVQPHAELEDIVVVFGAGVDLGDAVHDFAQRNAAPEVAHAHGLVLDAHLQLLAIAHDELVNPVVYDLLEQDVTAVIIVRAVTDPANVHAGAQPDVFERGEGFNFALIVTVFFSLRHRTQPKVSSPKSKA